MSSSISIYALGVTVQYPYTVITFYGVPYMNIDPIMASYCRSGLIWMGRGRGKILCYNSQTSFENWGSND